MSSRPAVKTAFDNLRPTILRQPARTVVTPEAEARLLETHTAVQQNVRPAMHSDIQQEIHSKIPAEALPAKQSRELLLPTVQASVPEAPEMPQRALLKKKKKDLLIPVTFRMPQSLKERLEQIARLHEINQTDLINEAIDLNLQRYS